jgi:hypothetical protein
MAKRSPATSSAGSVAGFDGVRMGRGGAGGWVSRCARCVIFDGVRLWLRRDESRLADPRCAETAGR